MPKSSSFTRVLPFAPSLVDEDVVRLEVAVDDALFVRRLERVDDLQEHVERARHRHAPLLHALAERLALQPLHHEVRAPVGQHAEREDVDEVRMADLIDRARLVDEALDGVLVGAQPPRDHLDRDLLADERMGRGEHRRHAAFAELPLDAVLADDRAGAQILFARECRSAASGSRRVAVRAAVRTVPSSGQTQYWSGQSLRHRLQTAMALDDPNTSR